ncbi:MAG: hypothetical protein A2V67_02615 [Deltaproteobacteria bacterium RBG_13_61_14]|nr:MAG: hypothetical protein A2V67_02615 [Deltaproteobacteria bacterium RBG_13_61_14]
MENDQGIRVLLVDDEEQFRAATSTILNRRGFSVTAAANGREALEKIRKDTIDVVILDLKMPEMDGNEVLRELKRLKPELPVIMLTGRGSPDIALAGLQEGLFDYLTKPCNLDLLARRVRDAFARRRQLSRQEHRVKDVMVPLTSFSSVREDRTLAEAIEVIMISFNRTPSTSTVQASMHRSILVLDPRHKVIGLVSFTDLLQGLQAPALSAPAGPAPANGPAFPTSGAFTLLSRDLGKKLVREVMSPAPITIDAEATLLEAAHRMLELKVRRLLVQDNGKTVGVIREQDLFFEMAMIIREQSE